MGELVRRSTLIVLAVFLTAAAPIPMPASKPTHNQQERDVASDAAQGSGAAAGPYGLAFGCWRPAQS